MQITSICPYKSSLWQSLRHTGGVALWWSRLVPLRANLRSPGRVSLPFLVLVAFVVVAHTFDQ
jgi:hypothetical protein